MKIDPANKHLLTEEVKNLIFKLENDSLFAREATNLRNLYSSKEITDSSLTEQVRMLLGELRIPAGWLTTITDFIKTGEFDLANESEISIETQGSNGTRGFYIEGKKDSKQNDAVKIAIYSRITKQKLINWINNHWEDIELGMNVVQLNKGSLPKWQERDLYQQIKELREKDKSFMEIGNLLDYDQDFVKNLYHRYTKAIKNH